MKKLNVLVATIALLAASTVASAADSAWFSLEGASGNAVATQGSGTTLAITKGLLDQTLTIGFNITSASGGLNSWAVNLTGTTDPGKTLTVDAFTRLGTGYDTPTGGNAPTDLASGGTFSVGNASITQTGSAGLVFTFDLTITGKTAGSVTQIFGSVGSTEIFRNDAYVWQGTVGPNASIYGYANTSFGSLPVITITNVPEPATMALLGLGVVALIRRRR